MLLMASSKLCFSRARQPSSWSQDTHTHVALQQMPYKVSRTQSFNFCELAIRNSFAVPTPKQGNGPKGTQMHMRLGTLAKGTEHTSQ